MTRYRTMGQPNDGIRYRRRRRQTLAKWLGLFLVVMLGIFGGGWILGIIVANWLGL